jgi:hypothetical protein
MLDYTSILSIFSVILGAILAAHLTFTSRCFGCEVTIQTSQHDKIEIDVKLPNDDIIETDIDIKTGEIHTEFIEDTKKD